MTEKHYLEILAHRWESYLTSMGGWFVSCNVVWPPPDYLSDLPDFVVSMYWALSEGLRPNLQYAPTTKDKLESMVLAWDKLATYGTSCKREYYIRYGDCS